MLAMADPKQFAPPSPDRGYIPPSALGQTPVIQINFKRRVGPNVPGERSRYRTEIFLSASDSKQARKKSLAAPILPWYVVVMNGDCEAQMDKAVNSIKELCRVIKHCAWEIGTTVLFVVVLVKFLLYEVAR